MGQKSTNEWIGEEFFICCNSLGPVAEDDGADEEIRHECKSFPFTVVAHTRCEMYAVKEKGFGRIPQ